MNFVTFCSVEINSIRLKPHMFAGLFYAFCKINTF